LPGAIGTIKLPERQINGSSYTPMRSKHWKKAHFISSGFLSEATNAIWSGFLMSQFETLTPTEGGYKVQSLSGIAPRTS